MTFWESSCSRAPGVPPMQPRSNQTHPIEPRSPQRGWSAAQQLMLCVNISINAAAGLEPNNHYLCLCNFQAEITRKVSHWGVCLWVCVADIKRRPSHNFIHLVHRLSEPGLGALLLFIHLYQGGQVLSCAAPTFHRNCTNEILQCDIYRSVQQTVAMYL